MSMDQCNYTVVFDDYTKNHYVKSFKKKYGDKAWALTENAIISVCEHIDKWQLTNLIDKIKSSGDFTVYKIDFTVPGTKESPKTSGNRYIALADEANRTVRVLFVYAKTDIVGNHETVWWKKVVSSINENAANVLNI